MKINWKVRLKQPAFWIATIPVVITFAYSILALADIVPAVTEERIQNLFLTVVTILAQLGIIIDPTTKGICDSERAMKYDKPN